MATLCEGAHTIRDLQVCLAEIMIEVEVGDRLPSIRKIAEKTQMSIGSVSAAVNGLEEMGAVRIQKRGHLGSVVVERSLGKLWNLIEQGPLVIAMTLPMHSHFEGLATGVKLALEKAGIETYMIFIRGSRTRQKALLDNRCHVAIMSALAADEIRGKQYEIVLKLPPGSWISGYCTYYRTLAPAGGKALRVGVDPESSDHKRITELEFAGQSTEILHASFVQFPRLLKNGSIDALIWTSDQQDAYLGDGVQFKPISERVMRQIGNKSLSAAFVTRAGSHAVRAVLNAVLNSAEILEIQEKIITGKMIPTY